MRAANSRGGMSILPMKSPRRHMPEPMVIRNFSQTPHDWRGLVTLNYIDTASPSPQI